MKAYVYVSLKRSVLDPQGKTIQGALHKLGYKGLQDVRQGKYFELTLDGGLDRAQAEEVGADGYLTKPFTQDEFIQQVVRLLAKVAEATPGGKSDARTS